MAKADVLDIKGAKVGEVELKDADLECGGKALPHS